MASCAALSSPHGNIITHATNQRISLWPAQIGSIRRCWSLCKCSIRSSPVGAADVTAILEDVVHEGQQAVLNSPASGARQSSVALAGSAPAANDNPKEPLYKALLAIILKLAEQPQQQHEQQQGDQQHQLQTPPQPPPPLQLPDRLEAFVRSQPTATSVPFISWLADLEATVTGAQKVQLAWLCEVLVVLREVQDEEGQEQLYTDTIRLLSGGSQQVAALMSAAPRQYALALAEGLTGQPLALQGYGLAYDMLLQVAPPAALTPTAVAQGHQLAADLAGDLSSRRKSTLAAMLGRTRVTPEQQAQLMGGSPASRICDLLLTLSSSEERFALLPDCFTPPPAANAVVADAAGLSGGTAAEIVNTLGTGSTAGLPPPEDSAASATEQAQEAGQESEMEELWCTPIQLLNEIDRRLKMSAAAAAAAVVPSGADRPSTSNGNHSSSSSSSNSNRQLLAAGGKEQQQQKHLALSAGYCGSSGAVLMGESAVSVLQELKRHIESSWLQSVFAAPGRRTPVDRPW